MRPFFFSFLLLGLGQAEPLPIDPLWESETFRRAFTGSYGVDARIEPPIMTTEAAVLERSRPKWTREIAPERSRH